MDSNAELNTVSTENVTLVEGNLYQHVYVRENEDDALSLAVDNNSVKIKELPSMGEIPINIILNTTKETIQERHEDQVLYSFREGDTVINSNATEDESMAVEALRQLGNSTIHTKVPQDLPLLTCSNCNAQFQTTSSFQNHVKICKEEQLKCNVCNEVFGHAIDFNNHIIGHAVARPHSCRICSTLFINDKDLEEHIQMHATVNTKITNQCGVCGIVFQRPSSLTNHMKIHTYLPGRNLANSIAPEYAVTNISEEIVNTKNVISTLNWEDYNGFKTEELYANLEIAQEMTIGNFEEDKLLLMEYDQTDLKLDVGDELVASSDLFKDNDRPYTCKFCKRRFAREKALKSHYKLHSNVLERYICCKSCEEYLTDEESVNKHQLNCKNKESVNNTVQEEEVKDVVLVCRSRTKFYKHVCLKCDKRFSTKQKLHRHMWIHRRKTFSCEICACLFEKREELDSHRLSTHQANSAYVCHDCGKSFTSRQGLWEHSRLHGDGSQLYKCKECVKTFSSRQGYLIHKRTHNDERPYGCRFCWKSFRDGGTMRKHERIHTGERPHVCPLCNRAFNQKVVLREHVRCLHAGTQLPNEDDIYDCNLCDQKLTDRDELCAHIVKHSDQLASLAKEASKNSVNGTKIETNKVKRKLNSKMNNKVVIEILPTADTANSLLDRKALHECVLCGDRFFTDSDLAEHIRIHI